MTTVVALLGACVVAMSAGAMLHAARPPLTAARRGQLCVGFTGLNLGLGVVATEVMPKGPVATAVELLFLFFFVLGAIWDVRLWRRAGR